VCLLERDLKDELSEVFMGVEKRKLWLLSVGAHVKLKRHVLTFLIIKRNRISNEDTWLFFVLWEHFFFFNQPTNSRKLLWMDFFQIWEYLNPRLSPWYDRWYKVRATTQNIKNKADFI
jgi:hypothetical protein